MVGMGSTSGALLQALHQFQANRTELSQSLTRLSTGQRINRGADDPAGLISSQRLESVLAVLEAETRSMQRTDHVASTAEAPLSEVSALLRENKGLEVQLANTGALSQAEQDAIQFQIDSNTQAIGRITSAAGFNGQALFNGSVSLTVGNQTLDLPSLSVNEIGATDIGGTTYDLSDTASGGALVGNPAGASQVLDSAITQIATLRGRIGAFQKNAIDSATRSNNITSENLAEAVSEIADTDFASEIATLNRHALLDKASLKTLGIISRSQDYLMDLLS